MKQQECAAKWVGNKGFARLGRAGWGTAVLGPAVLAFGLLSAAGPARAAQPLSTWHVRPPATSPTAENFEGVAYGNGRWVIVGDNGSILSSPDGSQWTAEVNPAAPARLDDVAFGGGVFVAVGRLPKMLLTSTDGREWTKREPTMSGAMEIIHDGSRFIVLAAGGFVFTSANGVDWEQTTRVPSKYDVGGIATGNGVWVEVGYKRTGQPPDCWASTDFENWAPQDSKLDENLMNVAFGAGLFIATGQGGALATSPDGVQWTPRTVPHTGFIWEIAGGGGYLAAAAQWGRVLVSQNGIDWEKHETGLSFHLTDIAFGNGTFVAVGWEGQIVQSDPVSGTVPIEDIRIVETRRDGNGFALKFNGTVGKSYEVQASGNLVDWQPLTSITCTQPLTSFTDPAPAASRFYRVRSGQ